MITGMISGAYHHRATSTHPISWMRGCQVLEIASPDIGSPVPGDKVVVLTADEFAEVQMLARRPVPVPETERVQLGVAVVGGLLAICREGGTLDLGRGDVRIHTENGALVASTSESMFTVEIDPDGTIEVLKDGDR